MEDLRIEKILRVVESVPRGRAVTYKTVGLICGESPRVVGRVMSLWGSNVTWWRVCNAKGEIPGHAGVAQPHWKEEGIAVRRGRESRVDLARVGLDSTELEEISRDYLAALPEK